MSQIAVMERAWQTFPEAQRMGAIAGVSYDAAPTGQTVPAWSITTLFTPVTTTIYVMSAILPKNLPIYQVGCYVGVIGTTTGFWQGIATQGGIVRAVSANAVTGTAEAYYNQVVTPASGVPYFTEYAGLYYLILGIVTSVAGSLGATTALANAGVSAGPPIYCGTSSVAATTTPAVVGSSLATLTGTVGGVLYMQTS